jgi:hypothetical protein
VVSVELDELDAFAASALAPPSCPALPTVTVVELGSGVARPRSRVELARYPSVVHVSKNMNATTEVTRCKKLPAPRPPKTCCEAAPDRTPMPPERPLCKSTTPIKKRQRNTWIIVRNVVIAAAVDSTSARAQGPREREGVVGKGDGRVAVVRALVNPRRG